MERSKSLTVSKAAYFFNSVSFNIRLCQVLENLVGVGKSKLYFIELNEWGCAGVWRRPVFFEITNIDWSSV